MADRGWYHALYAQLKRDGYFSKNCTTLPEYDMRYNAFWLTDDGDLEVIDQTALPHTYRTVVLKSGEQVVDAIQKMVVRGAGTIGSVAAFGIYLAARETDGKWEKVKQAAASIRKSRPTAINLMWAIDRMMTKLAGSSGNDLIVNAREEAIRISDEDVERTVAIGNFGCDKIEEVMKRKGIDSIRILTHCNAGWLGIANSGTALAPIYEAHRRGIKVHVWVDETRPRNQGALTAWELRRSGIDHTLVVDNAGGLLMQKGMVDIVFVGADRVTRNGDVANKIGTYLKALAAFDNGVPFYVGIPASTFDFDLTDGMMIPIEERSEEEVLYVTGTDSAGNGNRVAIAPDGTKAMNPAFDVTPARLVTGIITERGIANPNETAIVQMFGDLCGEPR